MPILTLTTDWGVRDHYLASFKGELLCKVPSLQIIDISHEVEKFNTMAAAFIVKNSFHKFPKGSIHYISVSNIENPATENPYVLIYTNGQYLLGEDNGIFTLILGENKREIIKLPILYNSERTEINNGMQFVIENIAQGKDFHKLGTSSDKLVESYFAKPIVDSKTIHGSIIFIDGFGNAVLNVTKELFEQEKGERSFNIHMRNSDYVISKISPSYEDVDVGEFLALFNQDGLMEIAINRESSGKLLGLKLLNSVRIEFNDR